MGPSDSETLERTISCLQPNPEPGGGQTPAALKGRSLEPETH